MAVLFEFVIVTFLSKHWAPVENLDKPVYHIGSYVKTDEKRRF